MRVLRFSLKFKVSGCRGFAKAWVVGLQLGPPFGLRN